MLSELLLAMFILMISVQSSSLWVSLFTIPLSVLLINLVGSHKSCGLIVLVFIMIFIGGLLVLLVSVSSSVYQEQALSPGAMVTFFSLLITSSVVLIFKTEWSQEKLTLFFWMNKMKLDFLVFSVSLVVISLVVMSMLLMEFKGITRKL